MAKGHIDRETGLTPSQERFCLELIQPDVSQAEAYRRAFPRAKKWKDKAVWEEASKTASLPAVRARVKKLLSQVSNDGIISAEETLRMLSRVAVADIRKCFRDDGTLKAPHEIDDVTAAGLLGFETLEVGKGDAKARKVRLINRVEALDKLMRHYGKYEKDNHQKPDDALTALLKRISGSVLEPGSSPETTWIGPPPFDLEKK